MPAPAPQMAVTAAGQCPTFAQLLGTGQPGYGGYNPQSAYTGPGYQPGAAQGGGQGYFPMPQMPQMPMMPQMQQPPMPAGPQSTWMGQWQRPTQTYVPAQQPVMPMASGAGAYSAMVGQQGAQQAQTSGWMPPGPTTRYKEEQAPPSWQAGQGSGPSSSDGTPQMSPALPETLEGVSEEAFFNTRQYRALPLAQTKAALKRFPLFRVEFLRLLPKFVVHVLDEGGNPQAYINRRLAERRGVTDAERFAITEMDKAFTCTEVDSGVREPDGSLSGRLTCLVRSRYAVNTLKAWLVEEHHAIAGQYPVVVVAEMHGGAVAQFTTDQYSSMRSGVRPKAGSPPTVAKKARQEQPG